MTRWAMIADLRRCVGCQTCTAACKHSNATSKGVQWRSVLDVELGAFPDVSRVFVPVGCMHCDDPPCVPVCPSTATRKREDGLVTMDYDLCIGCASCALACPYQARFKVDDPGYAYGGEGKTRNEAQRSDPARVGVAQKCTFCIERIDDGLAQGLTPGVDPAATPACVNSCIADALHFGDLDNPDSNVSQMIRDNETFGMHEELGTSPNIHYIWAAAAEAGRGPTPSSPSHNAVSTGTGAIGGVAPWQQRHWDWRAAGNFIGGGSGTGLLLATIIAVGFELPLMPFGLLGIALVGAGLTCVWFETGRPFRAPLNVLFHPQTSWMSRESIIGLVLFPLALAGAWFDSAPLMLLAALAGLGFLYCQARILRALAGIPAWRVAEIVPLIVATGLSEGLGLFLVVLAILTTPAPTATTLSAVLLLAGLGLRAWAWWRYRQALSGSAPSGTLAEIARLHPGFLGVGHIVPALLLLGALAVPDFATVAAATAGLLAAMAGWALKFVVVIRASYNQGFAIAHSPERGVGGGGLGAKPGWSVVP